MPLQLIAYDITHPRRLRRAARLCERFAQRLQDSVYLADLDQAELQRLMLALARIIDAATDSVRYVPVCAEDQRASRGLGLCRGLTTQPDHWVV